MTALLWKLVLSGFSTHLHHHQNQRIGVTSAQTVIVFYEMIIQFICRSFADWFCQFQFRNLILFCQDILDLQGSTVKHRFIGDLTLYSPAVWHAPALTNAHAHAVNFLNLPCDQFAPMRVKNYFISQFCLVLVLKQGRGVSVLLQFLL